MILPSMASGREKKTVVLAVEEEPWEWEEETSSESGPDEECIEVDDDDTEDETATVEELWGPSLATELGNGGVILVLLEMPSGFAIFCYDGVKLLKPNACQNIWADFAYGSSAKRVACLLTFQTFEDKSIAISQHTGVSEVLTKMIMKNRAPEQKLAVGNMNYKEIIEDRLGTSCLCFPAVEELMWGLTIQLGNFVPAKDSGMSNEDRLPMSEGMKTFLNSHSFQVEPDMMVTKSIIATTGHIHECDRCVRNHEISLRAAGEFLKEISQIDTEDWDLMKLATAFMIICFPEENIKFPRWLFSREQLQIFREHAHKYENKILKMPLMVVYNDIYQARELRFKVGRKLFRLVRQAKKEYEAEQAREGTDGMKIHPGIKPATVDELTEYDTMIAAERNKRKVPPTLAPADALERYARILSRPLHRMNKPGILSMDIHPSKEDIIATGGIDKNAVLFDRQSGQIVCTLTGHSKKITSLKFLNRDELLITGSADKTVRIWQGSEDRNYSCIHTLKDHTAEVKAVTVHPTQKYFVTASKDNTWCFYDTSTGTCLTQVGEASGQEGYTSASFHPDGLVLGTGTTDAVVKIWDVKTQSNVTKFEEHVGTVTAMSFSENGYFLATAALDGVKLWDLRKLRCFSTLAPYDSGTPTNAVDFDFSGSYLAIGGSDVRVYQVADVTVNWNVIKKLPDLSKTGKVTSVKFGADAKYIVVGSMDRKLRIFGSKAASQPSRT